MVKFLSSLIICVIISSYSYAETAKINDIFNSVVKIQNGDSFGTGNCINIDEDFIYLITNHHVAGAVNNHVKALFYKDGHESIPIDAVVIWTTYVDKEPIDISVLKVKKSLLGGWVPTIVNFEYNDELLKINDPCLTIGCPKAAWPEANRGHIVKVANGTYLITPIVIPGQSGSVLFNKDGTKAIGLIGWYDGSYGEAMTVQTLQRAVFGQKSNYYFKQPYHLKNIIGTPCSQSDALFRHNRDGGGDCPDGNCPNGKCPNGKCPNQKPKDTTPSDKTPSNPPAPGGGIKIFPTAPEDKNDVAPVAPSKDKDTKPAEPSDLDKYKTENDGKISGLDGRLKKTEDSLSQDEASRQNLLASIAKLEGRVNQVDTNNQLLTAKVADTPSKADIITPGKLTDLVKPQLDAFGQSVDKKLQDYGSTIGDSVNKLETKVNDGVLTTDKAQVLVTPIVQDIVAKAVTGVNDKLKDVDTLKTDLSKITGLLGVLQQNSSNNSEKVSSETNNTVIKEVMADKTNDRYLTIGGLTVPWAVILALGYFLRNRFNGGATQPPFPVLVKKVS